MRTAAEVVGTQAGMDQRDTKVHSFIVKLWPEQAEDETDRPIWHGYITHVPDGERRYLKGLSDITEFIARYLGEMSMDQQHDNFLRRWSKRLRRGFKRRG